MPRYSYTLPQHIALLRFLFLSQLHFNALDLLVQLLHLRMKTLLHGQTLVPPVVHLFPLEVDIDYILFASLPQLLGYRGFGQLYWWWGNKINIITSVGYGQVELLLMYLYCYFIYILCVLLCPNPPRRIS